MSPVVTWEHLVPLGEPVVSFVGGEVDAVPLRLATFLTVVLVAVSVRGGEMMAVPQHRDEVAGPDLAHAPVAQQEAYEERRRVFCETLDGTPDCNDFAQKEIRWLHQTMEEQFCGGECPEAMPILDIKDQRTPVQRLVAMEELAHRMQDEKIEADIRSRCPSQETVMTLRRTPGYTSAGFSISYDLAICGDGTVTYQGSGCVRLPGAQSAKIDTAEVQRLVQAFLDADYFGMTDYRPRVSDAPNAHTSLTLGQRRKRVIDYDSDAAPEKLRLLENMIDKVAGSNRWINIDAAGVKEKIHQGWDIRSPEAGLLLLKAATAGDADTVRAFIEQGANVNAKVDTDAWASCRPPRRVTDPSRFVTPLLQARSVEVVRLLIDAGANVNLKTAFEAPLRFQVEMGDADSVKALIEAGASVEGSWINGATALMCAVNKPNGPSPASVEALLRAGANVNAKDDFGRTVLDMVRRFSVNNVTIIADIAEDEAQRKRFVAELERDQIAAGEVERMLISAGAVSGDPVN